MFNNTAQKIEYFKSQIQYLKDVVLGQLSMSAEDRPAFNRAWEEIEKLEFKIAELKFNKQ